MGFGFNQSGSESAQRGVTDVKFPYGFVKGLNNTIGRPFSIDELLSLSPVSEGQGGGLSGLTARFVPQGRGRGLGRSLGFGEASANGENGAPAETGPNPQPGEAPPDNTDETKYTLGDVLSVYDQDPEKAMDVQRLVKKGYLNPDGFTISEFQAAVDKDKGLSGRSRGNLVSALGRLQDQKDVTDLYQTNRFGGPRGLGY